MPPPAAAVPGFAPMHSDLPSAGFGMASAPAPPPGMMGAGGRFPSGGAFPFADSAPHRPGMRLAWVPM